MRQTNALSILIVLFLTAALPAVENWRQFRGPEGQGISDAGELPLTWDAETNIAWRTELAGAGWSSPVITNERIYLTSAVVIDEQTKDRSLRVSMLNAKNGQVLKSIELFKQDGGKAPKIHSKNSHASPTPLLNGDTVYVHFGHQGTAALDMDLNVKWRKQLSYKPVHGNGGTPIVVDGKLIFSCDGAADPFIVALDTKDGSQVWKTSRKSDASRKFSFTTAQAIEVNGATQIISPGSNVVYSLDPNTGNLIWKVRYDGYSLIPRPVFHNGLVYICTGYKSPKLIAIRPDGVGDVTDTHVEWIVKSAVPHTASLLLDGDELYMVSDKGIASCLDAKTGDVVWKERLGGSFSSSPLMGAGRIYFQDEKGKATVVEVGRKFNVLAKNDLGERTLASYAAINGALLIRTADALYRVEGK